MSDGQVHIDIETVDIAHTAKILSIGAVCGSQEYYVELDHNGYPAAAGFTENQKTLDWWEQQGGFQPSGQPVFPFEAINGLKIWFDEVTKDMIDVTVWANSPSFDCEILKHHYAHWGLRCPWDFYQERDVRTAKDIARAMRLSIREFSNPHNALQDAKNQRDYVASVYATLADRMQMAKDCAEMYPGLENARGL